MAYLVQWRGLEIRCETAAELDALAEHIQRLRPKPTGIELRSEAK